LHAEYRTRILPAGVRVDVVGLARDAPDLLQFFHQVGFGVQAARGVGDDHVGPG
jgi:hypothetical protein